MKGPLLIIAELATPKAAHVMVPGLIEFYWRIEASLVAQMVNHLPAIWETMVPSPGWEGPLEKEIATHSSILAWRISRTKEPDRLQFMGSQSHTQVTSTFTFSSWSSSQGAHQAKVPLSCGWRLYPGRHLHSCLIERKSMEGLLEEGSRGQAWKWCRRFCA